MRRYNNKLFVAEPEESDVLVYIQSGASCDIYLGFPNSVAFILKT